MDCWLLIADCWLLSVDCVLLSARCSLPAAVSQVAVVLASCCWLPAGQPITSLLLAHCWELLAVGSYLLAGCWSSGCPLVSGSQPARCWLCSLLARCCLNAVRLLGGRWRAACLPGAFLACLPAADSKLTAANCRLLDVAWRLLLAVECHLLARSWLAKPQPAYQLLAASSWLIAFSLWLLSASGPLSSCPFEMWLSACSLLAG